MGLTWRAVSLKTELFSYGMEFAITLCFATNMLQFGLWRCSARPAVARTFFAGKRGEFTLSPKRMQWLPAMLLCAAAPLVLAQPLAVMIIYTFELKEAKLWRGGSWWPNTDLGRALLLCSYLGFFCLTAGVITVTNVDQKIAAKWRILRGGSSRAGNACKETQPAQSKVAVASAAVSVQY